ncbi:MAG: glycosyltransferase family 2 protein [Verrucomicrobiota bacterium]|nr:glycosyltransferase family 2 protein [Verrucomicrobiota bacterium]
MKISATIITFNEERNIKECLESLLDIADEIIVVDSYSTDQTEQICKVFNQVQFIKNIFEGHVEQKNFAVSIASNDFILSLDADERLSLELIDELKKIKAGNAVTNSAYSMPRLNNYCGKWIRHSGWYPDMKVRLWDRRIGRWGGTNPHDHIICSKNTDRIQLTSSILHYTTPSIKAHVEQTNKFSEIAAFELFRSKRKVAVDFKMLFDPFFTFFKIYFLKLGFLDGFYGLVIAVVSAHEKFLKFAKLKQLKSQHENSSS